MPEILNIQIPKIIDDYPSINGLKSFALFYSKDQWEKLCQDRTFLALIMEEKNLAKTKLLANSILGIKEEKNKKQNGGEDTKELTNVV